MFFYSVRWEKLEPARHDPINVITVQITCLDESGQQIQFIKKYKEWLGVCTNHIDKVIQTLQEHFPRSKVTHVPMGKRRRVLPYFPTRLETGRFDSPEKPFYKVFIQENLQDVGRFLNSHKIGYYETDDWLVRLYIDLCIAFNTQGFYYKWYTINDSIWLIDSFQMQPQLVHTPDWTIAAFDLETVPMDGGQRVPNGLDETDEIVMISLYKWNKTRGTQKWLFYRLPPKATSFPFPDGICFETEKSMLEAFHSQLEDAHVLTGYNINEFDLPCVFARLLWLKMYSILAHYTSSNVGTYVITTFQNKLVLDLYPYFKTFSNYDLPSFKLDDVARVKINASKIPVKSTGLHSWYVDERAASLLHASQEECYRVLKPKHISADQFGTFQQYIKYCLQDSFLVQQLFEKEMVLSFVIERANFTAWDAAKALYMGNSNFLLELFKTYGNVLGFFIQTHFLASPVDSKKYASVFVHKNTYQGALNHCIPEKQYENVSVLDFASMYPSTLLSSNLCYSSCTIMTRNEWLQNPRAQSMTTIPYRMHGDADFENMEVYTPFRYPPFDPAVDSFAIVINQETKAFLPCIVRHFIDLRKHHQTQYKHTRDVYHYNAQLNIKILINSLYGVMANKNSPLSYLPIAMTIVTLARYQLLGSFHFIKREGYHVCYADTDSLMVHQWPYDHCHAVNNYLNLPYVELKYEQRMKRLLVLSRKRYVYETEKNKIVTKGFQKRINELLEYITKLVLDNVWSVIFHTPRPAGEGVWWEENLDLESMGWLLWVEIIQQALYKCRDAKKYCITRKTKPLHEYKSKKCATVRMLERYPEKANDYIEYTYSRADVAEREASKWVMDAQECQWVNYEQLLVSQKKMFCLLLNMAFWKRTKPPMEMCNMVMNTVRWKQFMHAELMYWFETHRKIELLVETGTRYTFSLNNHTRRMTNAVRKRPTKNAKQKPEKKRKKKLVLLDVQVLNA